MDSDVLRRGESQSLILECLEHEPEATDLYWSLFLTAAFHYKVDSLLRPFPPPFVKDGGEKDVDGLRRTCDSFPRLEEVVKTRCATLDDMQTWLLWWVFSSRTCSLVPCEVAGKIAEFRSLTGEKLHTQQPSRVFELSYGVAAEAKFQALRSRRSLLHAYHGSRAENFYSILKSGLQSHMNKTSLFGEGTYLSSELSVAMEFSPLVPLLCNAGRCGSCVSIVALCELIDDGSVKCKRGTDGNRKSSRAPNSIGGDVPDKYYVVTNSEMMRVKYLLVYSSERTASASISGRDHSTTAALVGQMSFATRHQFELTMLLYLVLLFCIGLLGSKRFWSHMHRLYQRATDVLDSAVRTAAGEL